MKSRNRCGARTLVLAGLTTSLAVAATAVLGDPPGVGEIGGPTRVLTPREMEQWLAGRAVFDRDFHMSDGLGSPEMNGDSCRACHQDPVLGGSGGLALNVSRFGYDNGGAGPFQNLPGGQGLSRLRPPWEEGREEYDPRTADVFEQRQTPALFGAGLIDTILEIAITANEDPNDINGDGIYGVARLLNIAGTLEVGRFGWKAQAPRLGDFVRDALGGECGITTPDDGRGFALLTDPDPIADPELSQDDLDDLDFFLSLLGPPPRAGGQATPAVQNGEAHFLAVGCAVCHIPSLSGPAEPVPLYSNLLLHNVMPADYRGMEEPDAPAGFFRTPPLWGIRHTAPYMHDGRAETLFEAILAHDGEAAGVRDAFVALTRPGRLELIRFLEDL